MKLDDILIESTEEQGFDVKIRISGADLENIPDSLSYNITDVVLETKKGSVKVPDGGIVSLNIGPKQLAKRVAEATNKDAQEVINIKLNNPPSDFKLGSNKSTYSVTVEYVTDEGNREDVDLKFNDIDFNPSKSMMAYLNSKL